MSLPPTNAYIAIDLKSFYASVECVDRGLDPLTTNLVVADETRTDKTICLAVSPSLKAYGTGGRPRLFELKQKLPPNVDYIIAPPRMARYLEYSARVYKVYLKYFSPMDIHVYSIDEVFIDVAPYLCTYKKTPKEVAAMVIRDVLKQTGITATAGVGTNLYLCKVAMDIVAKHIPADKDGVRIAELDEKSYREQLWSHTPLTDFWRIGRGISRRLEKFGIHTMGDIARVSLQSENFLYKLFGVNAELLIDHAWGWEPCTIEQIKAYRPETKSLSSGQVLTYAYPAKKARVVAVEMAEEMAIDLLSKHLVTDQLVLTVGYDVESLRSDDIDAYQGEVMLDRYGRLVPKHAHGTQNLGEHTLSAKAITCAVAALYDRIVNPALLVRRLNLSANHVLAEEVARAKPKQLDLFAHISDLIENEREERKVKQDKERRLMEATLAVKKRFGKNSLLKGLNYEDGATARVRNAQIGGHKA